MRRFEFKKSLLIISPICRAHASGVEHVVYSMIYHLLKKGYNVNWLCGDNSITKPHKLEMQKLFITKWPIISLDNSYFIPQKIRVFFITLNRLARKVKVVHIHNAHSIFPVISGIILKKVNPSIKLIFTMHYHGTGHTYLRNILWKVFWRKIITKTIEYSDVVHSVSYYESVLIIRDYPIAKNKLKIIPNGVKKDTFQYKWKGKKSDYFLYAGRVERYKKLKTAIDLLTEMNKNGLNYKLLIIGEGRYLGEIKGYADKYAKNKVYFLPIQKRNRYLELISKAYATINLSENEAFSIFIAESLAIGTPAIVSQVIEKIYLKNKGGKCLANDIDPKIRTIIEKFDLRIISNKYVMINSWDYIVDKIIDSVYNI